MAKIHVSATVNGDAVDFLCDPEQTLLDVLRDELEFNGAKEGCGTGDCGACSVTLDGRLVCACLIPGAEVQGKTIETIEGMADGEVLHPLQRKFIAHAALQCGICLACAHWAFPGLVFRARAARLAAARGPESG